MHSFERYANLNDIMGIEREAIDWILDGLCVGVPAVELGRECIC